MKNMTDKFIKYVVDYYNKNNKKHITKDNVYIVWQCKTLHHLKALLSTDVSGDTLYVECTYNGIKNETYFDAYYKKDNIVIPYED